MTDITTDSVRYLQTPINPINYNNDVITGTCIDIG